MFKNYNWFIVQLGIGRSHRGHHTINHSKMYSGSLLFLLDLARACIFGSTPICELSYLCGEKINLLLNPSRFDDQFIFAIKMLL